MPSASFTQAVLAPETGEQLVLLVEISEAALSPPVRVCTGGADIVSLTRTFLAYPFEIDLPGEGDDQIITRGRLRIDNVDPLIVTAIKTAQTRPDVKLELILASAPDVIEKTYSRLKLGDPGADAATIDADLLAPDFSEEVFPKQAFLPSATPAVF